MYQTTLCLFLAPIQALLQCHIRKAKGIDNLYEHVNGSYFQYQKDKGFPKGVCLLEWLILSIAEIQRERTI